MSKKLLVRTVIHWLNTCAIILAMFYTVTPAHAAPNYLTAFVKISPPNGGTFIPLDATLSWASSSGAMLYNVCVSTDPSVSTCVFVYHGRSTSATLTGLSQNTTYYWQVEAEDRYGNLLDSSGGVWNFTTLGYAPPFNLTLSHSSVPENSNIGTEVGRFSATDPDIGDPLSFTLQAAAGCDGNSSFTIDGNILRTAQVFDYSTQSSYIICARVIDGTGNAMFRAFTITIIQVNSAPTNIMLSNSSLAENSPAYTTIGYFAAEDADTGDAWSFAFVSGDGSQDNALFSLNGGELYVTQGFDFEAKSAYSIRVRATDQAGAFYEKAFSIGITNLADSESTRNGGFEIYQPSKSKKPANWIATKFASTDGKSSKVKKFGKYSVKLGGATATQKTLTQTLAISGAAGIPLDFSYWVKANSLPQKGLCQAKVSFYNGTSLVGTKIVKCPAGRTYNWKQARLVFIAPTDFTKVAIKFIYSKASGTVWFDGASLLR